MFYHVKNLLNGDEVRKVLELTRTAQFVEGSATNKYNKAKRNLQMALDDPRMKAPGDIIHRAMHRNAAVHTIVRPLRMTPPMFSRYEPGMEYGDHADQGMFNVGGLIRADVSCTVFLNSADSYTGGELVIQIGNQEHRMKGEAGDAVLYPSTSLHRVDQVTEGAREVVVLWFQSVLRDPHQREILFNLQKALDEIILKELNPDLAVRLSYVQANLIRMWAEV